MLNSQNISKLKECVKSEFYFVSHHSLKLASQNLFYIFHHTVLLSFVLFLSSPTHQPFMTTITLYSNSCACGKHMDLIASTTDKNVILLYIIFLFKIFFHFIFLFALSTCVLPVVYVDHTCAIPPRREENAGSPGTGVTVVVSHHAGAGN